MSQNLAWMWFTFYLKTHKQVNIKSKVCKKVSQILLGDPQRANKTTSKNESEFSMNVTHILFEDPQIADKQTSKN